MKIKTFFAHLIPDLLLLFGVLCLTYGVYLIYQPAAYIVDGILLIYCFRPITITNQATIKNRKA